MIKYHERLLKSISKKRLLSLKMIEMIEMNTTIEEAATKKKGIIPPRHLDVIVTVIDIIGIGIDWFID